MRLYAEVHVTNKDMCTPVSCNYLDNNSMAKPFYEHSLENKA